MKSYPTDYLKYWRVIRFYMKSKHGLSQADLDIILFLYSEVYFDRSDFAKFAELVSWELGRFKRLWKEGWIEHFRKHTGRSRSIYQLSQKAKNVVLDIYRKLNGEEIPTSLSYNPMFLKNVKYTDKVYRTMILQMNAYYREQREKSRTKTTEDD